MKIKNLKNLGVILLLLLGLNSYGSAGNDASTGEEPREVIKMNIRFETERCQTTRDMSMCSISTPINPSSISKDIKLYPNLTICHVPPESGGSNSCNALQGHWIDLEQVYLNSAKRYIGIVTITKSTYSKSSNPGENLDWYHVEVEILGNGKTISKMETGVVSINQLQSVKLLAEEFSDGAGTTTTYLNVGPNLFPNIKGVNLKNENTNLETVKWNVIKGQILE